MCICKVPLLKNLNCKIESKNLSLSCSFFLTFNSPILGELAFEELHDGRQICFSNGALDSEVVLEAWGGGGAKCPFASQIPIKFNYSQSYISLITA